MTTFIKHKGWISFWAYPFFLCLTLSLSAQRDHAKSLLNLELTPGQAPTTPISETDLIGIYHQNLHDVFYLIFHESDSSFKALKPLKEARMEAIEAYSATSPWKGFILAEIELQWAFLKIKYGEEWGAFWSLRSAHQSMMENLETYPEFKWNRRTEGLLNILFGVTPDNYQWIFNLFGMKGSVKKGIDLLSKTQDNETIFGLESAIILGMVYSHLLEELEKAPTYIQGHQFEHTALANYFQGIILQKSHQGEKAMNLWLSEEPKIPFQDYLEAEVLFQQGEYQPCIVLFKRFIKDFSGETFRKDALLKIALANHFMGNTGEYQTYLSLAKASKSSESEVDKNAQRILDNMESQNLELLQLRYAIDGGFYGLADQLFNKLQKQDLTPREQVELRYRKARVAHLNKSMQEAIERYEQVIAEANLIEGSYFAPNAFLQLGYLQRQLGNSKAAKQYFQQVLNFEKHPYKSSLDSKAKVALSLLDLGDG